MARYHLHLHNGPSTPPDNHDIEVASDGDAEDLARITLLATSQFTHVELWKDGELIGVQKRDGHQV